ncbi:Fe(3+)-hydroxamate ABC transporter permease FhuB [Limoniibacter endophyticus]|uniref:Fe3+-hydroxamate ABC transporter permease FhuB n=1 Tax=Limoniibacter endophyticus TaxID=1565040 RepID=A0A8J3DSX4_9HYPH|nr:Fe(3+)-hydroxamate ABC transporter permease FhuB [Limoniibacter endophyticus]GHC73626.1 Fe3+-hydroxamate ABC transporter permease FhuB [Limoniibacter endophyticus]
MSADIRTGGENPVRLILFGVGTLALVFFGHVLWRDWPGDGDLLRLIVFYHSTLPRGAVALLAGAALGLASALMQRVLRNPIADPSTVGVASGAQLAMTAATIYAPTWMEYAREPVAFAGGAIALGLVLALSWRRSLDPVTVVISGMLISLVAASISSTIVLANGEYMMSLFIWGSGAMEQQSWTPANNLAIRLVLAAIAVALLYRPLLLLALDDANARALGLGVTATRFCALGVAVFLAASVSSEVGLIGFVGLAAPNMARLAGARTLRQVLVISPLIAAAILFLADGVVQSVSFGGTQLLPTGAATALLGGPFLLWLLPRLKTQLQPSGQLNVVSRTGHPRGMIAALTLAIITFAVAAILIGRSGTGWHIAQGEMFDLLFEWRWPRVLAGAVAGGMLAAAGFSMQRITGNAMASPEVLGVASGAGVGLATLLIFSQDIGRSAQFSGAFVGALAAMAIVLFLSARYRFGSERLLLSGIAVGALCGSIITIVIARGGPESMLLLAWLSGSTQNVTPWEAVLVTGLAATFITPLFFLLRWLAILPLGAPVAKAIGLKHSLATGVLIAFAACMTAAATLFVGPLSFVGLMAPHLARLAGFVRPAQQLVASILAGALLMIFSDWMARNLTFPYQLPMGLMTSLIGAPYLLWALNRRAR